MLETKLTRKLNVQYPLIQAPMAGGPTTPELVAAVSNAGGMGSLGAGYLAPDQIRNTIKEIRRLTDRPFGVNLFVPEEPNTSNDDIEGMNDYLNKYRAELDIASSPSVPKLAESFEEQVKVLLEENVPVFSFTFGIPSIEVIQAFKRSGTVVMGTATTIEEGIQLEAAGVDAVVAQGSEAGGHRGTFATNAADALIGTMALVPQMVDHLSVPVIASGESWTGEGLLRASS